MYWVMGILPFVLLLLGFPIFLLLLITSLVVLVGVFRCPNGRSRSGYFQQPQ